MMVGDNIRKIREVKKISRKTLAEKSGVSKSSVHYIESGRNSPTIETLGKLAVALGVTITDLLNDHSDLSRTG